MSKNIHDKFFKLGFSRIGESREFIKNYLPHKVVNLLDLKTIRLEKDSFIGKDQKEFFADLLFSVILKGTGKKSFVYVLYEHKSYPENNVLLQILGYMMLIWKEHYKNNRKDNLPRIIPVVVYHGRSNWVVPQMLSDMFDPLEKLDDFLPDFEAKTINLKTNPNIESKGSHALRLLLWSFKNSHDKNRIKNLVEIAESFLILLKKNHYQANLVLSYTKKLENLTYGEMFKKFANILDIEVKKMELMSETFRKKGHAEGCAEERAKMLPVSMSGIKLALKLKFGDAGLAFMNNIQNISDPDRLEQIIDAIESVSSLEDLRKHIGI